MSPCVEDKVMVSEFKSTTSKTKSNGTPMKMLIAQEMSKEVDSRHGPPSLIAKLMGLDTIPDQEPGSATQKSRLGHNRCHSEIPASSWEHQNGLFHYVEPNDYMDLYEIWQQSQKSTQKGRRGETAKQKKMAFVRQKFIEAKRLSMDEKLRQSKQFQDALEVLNSNKELFIRCLQEPNSVFSQQLYNLQSNSPLPETKRITVLKPSTIIEGNHLAGAGNKDGKQPKPNVFAQINGFEEGGKSPRANCPNSKNPSQPTRIVVLKPNIGNVHQDAAISSQQSQFAMIQGEGFAGNVEDSENLDSMAVAKAITQQMREKIGRQHRADTMFSSACSNGYVADESSFNKSDCGFPGGNPRDSEVMSPLSRHSWDYVNRLGSPYSSPSYGRASYSPESSVCREAKKRLSERWAMMASNASFQDQRPVRNNSSTLGEMLALSEAKKTEVSEKCSSSEEPKVLKSLFLNEPKPDDHHLCNSPHKLDRSKSVPVSSTPFATKLDAHSPVSDEDKHGLDKDSTAKSVKSSFRGMVSSYFFSKNKKNSKDKTLVDVSSDRTGSHFDRETDPALSGNPGSSSAPSSSELISMPVVISSEARLSMPGCIASVNPCKNHDQPSPISVLDPHFEDNEPTSKLLPGYLKTERHGSELSLNSVGSNLIDKSPPIGSIARTLSWNDSCLETTSLHPVKVSYPLQGRGEDREEWSFFLKTLLTASCLHGELQPSLVLARWHSPEIPLDPSLRDKYVDLNEKGTLHEVKRRQKRSMQKLVFDCVNAALIDIADHALGSGHNRAVPCIQPAGDASSTTVFEEVWTWINAFFGCEIRCVWDECGDESSLVLESVVRKEVVGNGWIDKLWLEMDSVGMEIERELVERLVEEAVVELAGRT